MTRFIFLHVFFLHDTFVSRVRAASIWIGSILIATALTLAGCGDNTQASKPPETPVSRVRVADVERKQFAQAVRATGTLVGKEESKLSFKIGGIVEKIYVSEGQSVKRGQLLATLKLSEINSQVMQARSAFEKAERDLKRAQNLYTDKVATLEQVQDATTGYEVSKSALSIAKFNQQYASITAPSSGKVLKKFSEENELIAPGTPVVMLSDARQGWIIRLGVADRDVVRLRVGDAATVALDAYPNRVFEATVSQLSASASPFTGTYDVELKVPATDAVFISGLIGKAEIAPSAQQPVSLVPAEAVVEADGNRGSVYTLTPEGTAKKRTVSISFIEKDKIAVSTGLEDAEKVITGGAAYLTDGAKVQVVE